MDALSYFLSNESETLGAGGRFSLGFSPGLFVALSGPLGAGKTTFVRGVLHALGVEGRVKSPTYSLMEAYEIAPLLAYHFDFYRFESGDDWKALGFDEYFGAGHQRCLVEWPERAPDLMVKADVWLNLSLEADGRRLQLQARTPAGETCLNVFIGMV